MKRKKTLLTFIIIGMLLIFTQLQGEIIQLKDGTKIKGKIIKQDDLEVRVQDEKGIIQIIPREKIENILPEIPLTPSFTIDQTGIKEAGQSLKKYTTLYYTGAGAIIFGSMLTLPYYVNPTEENLMWAVLGAVFQLSGVIIELGSHYFIYKAGKKLEEAVK